MPDFGTIIPIWSSRYRLCSSSSPPYRRKTVSYTHLDVYKRQVLKRAGLPRIRFHDLRHTFATMALQNGVDVKTVSRMLGHYSAGFTLDTYAHVTTDAQLKAAQTMGNLLSRAV